MDKKSFYDKRHTKTYIVKYSPKFLRDNSLTIEKLCEDILHYLEYFYFTKQEKFFRVDIHKDLSIGYHKIETQVQGRSRKNGGRTLAFFIIHDESENAYIMPTFFFGTQEEKIYTTNHLTSPQFGSKLLQKLERFENHTLQECVIRQPQNQ